MEKHNVDLVLFDLDNTLIAGDSDFSWGEFLISKGAINGKEHQAQNRAFYEDYRAGTLNIYAYIEYQFAPLARNSRARLEAWREEFMRTIIMPMITDKARALVKHHIDRGALVAVVTATNTFVTAPIVRELGISHLIGTVAAQENGRFTGKARGLPAFQRGKVARVEDWLESYGDHLGGFEQSWFYSDSRNDLPLLEHVTHPVAVDPDDELRARAAAEGWDIISLR